MNKGKHKKILNIIAVIVLVLVFINVLLNAFYWGDGWTEIFWYCNLASFLLAVGILWKRVTLISVVLVSSIPAQFFWILDFVLKVIGFAGFGRTTELFVWPLPTIVLSVVLHLLLIPLAVYATLIHGFKRRILGWILVFMVILMAFPFFLSSYEDNINCVFYSCDLSFTHYLSSNPSLVLWDSLPYLGLMTLKWTCCAFIFYGGFLFLFQRIFKRVKLV